MQSDRLHRSDGHDFVARGVVSFEHGVQDALEVADFIGGVGGCELGDGVAGGVDEGVDAGARGLVVSAADFEVEGRDGAVGGGDVGGEVSFGHVFWEGLPLLCLRLKCLSLIVGKLMGVYRGRSRWPRGLVWLLHR